MPNIRIKDIPTTASATSSTDFIAVDGSANGTRKLNAYSPTFGGNVTASGNLTVSGVTTSAGISNSGALTFTAAIGQVAGSIAKNATYGLAYYGVTGSSNDNTMLNASGAVVLSNPAGTTNATLAGNLTVSGRDLTLGSSESVIFFGTSSANYLYYNGSSLFLRVASVDRITIPASTGNVLIGTTVDSSALLQVGTNTTTAAGGMKFGTDTSLYRTGTGSLAIDGGTLPILRFFNGATQYGYVYAGSSDGELACVTGPLRLKSNNTTALTLDGSQNATFAGNLNVNGTASSFGGFANAGGAVYVRKDSGEIFRADAAGAGYRIVADQNGVDLGGARTTVGGNLTVSGTQNVLGLPASASALSTNSTMTFELTSNTSLTIKVRGTDGTTRSVALTLA